MGFIRNIVEALPGGDGIADAVFGKSAKDSYTKHNKDREAYAKKLQGLKADPNAVADYATQGGAPVSAAEDSVLAGAANAYARRGLGGTPVSSAAGRDASLQAAVQRSQTGATSRNLASKDALRGVMDAYGAKTGRWVQQNQQEMSDAATSQSYQAMVLDALSQLAGEYGNNRDQEELLRKLQGGNSLAASEAALDDLIMR